MEFHVAKGKLNYHTQTTKVGIQGGIEIHKDEISSK